VTRRFLALGDSYTIGEGVRAEERWPMQLAAGVRATGIRLADPEIIATTGWTTGELLAAIHAVAPPPRDDFDIVSLQIGVNDQYRGLGVDVFRAGLTALTARAIHHAANEAGRVVVLSIPDWSVTPFATSDPRDARTIAAQIDSFNAAARVVTREAGIAFVDVTTDSRRALDDQTLIAADGLHPSAAMYANWVRIVLPAALRTLRTL
jgi:lysophospholipase L1-like esterase